jgi:hypothetical protein
LSTISLPVVEALSDPGGLRPGTACEVKQPCQVVFAAMATNPAVKAIKSTSPGGRIRITVKPPELWRG